MKVLRVILCLLIFTAASLSAATYIVPSDRDLVRKSDAIIVGSVLGSYSQRTATGGIETVYEFGVAERIKGPVTQREILRVVEPGGVIGNEAEEYSGAPVYFTGEKVLLFLSKGQRGRWHTAGLGLGKFHFAQTVRGDRVLVRDEVNGWDENGRLHAEMLRNEPKFLTFVRETSLGRAAPTTYWEQPQALKITGETRPIHATIFSTADYSAQLPHPTNGTFIGARWQTFGAGIEWRKTNSQNLAGAPNNGIDAITAAIAAWNNDCGSTVNYIFAGGTDVAVGGTVADGIRSVLFNDPNSEIPGSFGNPFSTIAVARRRFTTPLHQHEGDDYWTTTDADVIFQDGYPGNNIALQSAMTHEFGHTLGWRHSDKHNHLLNGDNTEVTCDEPTHGIPCSTTAIMVAVTVGAGPGTALQGWDQAAVRSGYPGGNCTPKRGDFNNDNFNDLIWRNYGTGDVNIWNLNQVPAFIGGANLFNVAPVLGWRLEASGDFDGNNSPDLLWRNYINGQVNVWFLNGTTYMGGANLFTVADLNWHIEGVADFDGDADLDIIWRNYSTGEVNVWFLDGTTFVGGANLFTVADTLWTLEGTGDFDGDTDPDLIWRHYGTGAVNIWFLNGTSFVGGASLFTIADLNWKIQAIEDFDGNLSPDLVWRNMSTGDVNIWRMSGTTFLSGANLFNVNDANWEINGPH